MPTRVAMSVVQEETYHWQTAYNSVAALTSHVLLATGIQGGRQAALLLHGNTALNPLATPPSPRGSPRTSPRTSPRGSPRTSPRTSPANPHVPYSRSHTANTTTAANPTPGTTPASPGGERLPSIARLQTAYRSVLEEFGQSFISSVYRHLGGGSPPASPEASQDSDSGGGEEEAERPSTRPSSPPNAPRTTEDVRNTLNAMHARYANASLANHHRQGVQVNNASRHNLNNSGPSGHRASTASSSARPPHGVPRPHTLPLWGHPPTPGAPPSHGHPRGRPYGHPPQFFHYFHQPHFYHVVRLMDLQTLFNTLLTNFYFEVFLWMYLNILLHPRSRQTRNRLKFLASLSNQTLEQTTMNVLTGYFNGYQQGREALIQEISNLLTEVTTSPGHNVTPDRALWLRELSVELGLHLNPRQMLRSFSAVVRDVIMQRVTAPSRPDFTGYEYITDLR